MDDDIELLRRYARDKSEAAFTELVERHLDFVYAAALRRLNGDTHLAEDVAQQVFSSLATKAGELSARTDLTGWLFVTARYAAATVVRGEQRRRRREQKVMSELHREPEEQVNWEQLRPVIDGALDQLKDEDRQAILMRFFQERSIADIAAKLTISEDNARKRLQRALDRLQGFLSQRGIKSAQATIAGLITAHSALSAPPGLASAITSKALLAANATTATTLLSLFSMSSAKSSIVIAAAVVAFSLGTAAYQTKRLETARAEIAAAETERDAAIASAQRIAQDLATEKSLRQNLETPAQNTPARDAAPATQTSIPPPTIQELMTRYQRAIALTKEGSHEAALREFLWCYDEGTVKAQASHGIRLGMLSGLGELAAKYPPAAAALRARRDAALKRMEADPLNHNAAMEFSAVNKALKEDHQTTALYDSLRPNDPRRAILAANAYDNLIENRRYADAAQITSYARMTARFEGLMAAQIRPASGALPEAESAARAERVRQSLVKSTVKDIEVLAGIGALDDARTLAAKLIGFDDSPDTREAIKKQTTRAGHPDFVSTLPKLE